MNQYVNVILHGQKNKDELASDVQNMECFLLIYSEDTAASGRSNSHKILEDKSCSGVCY